MNDTTCPSGHDVPVDTPFCPQCGQATSAGEPAPEKGWRDQLGGFVRQRASTITATLGAVILVAVVGSWAWNSWVTSRLLDNFSDAIASDDLTSAQSVVSEMKAFDPEESRFADASEQLEGLLDSRGHFEAAERAVEAGDFREAVAQFSQVAAWDVARADAAALGAQKAREQFEIEVLTSATALIDSDPRQAFWTIKNEEDFLGQTPPVTEALASAVAATTISVDASMRDMVDLGNIVGAAKLWMQTQDALVEYGDQFAADTQWFAERFEQEKATALTKVYSWEGGPDAATRYFDRAAVRYTLVGSEIRWITADALELHIYENPDSLALYLKAMLYHPRWVMAESVVATIDGEQWDLGFPPDAIERYEGNRNTWEGAWRGVIPADVDSLMAIAMSDQTTIEFRGPSDRASFTLNAADKAGIQNMLLAYFALGADPRSLW